MQNGRRAVGAVAGMEILAGRPVVLEGIEFLLDPIDR